MANISRNILEIEDKEHLANVIKSGGVDATQPNKNALTIEDALSSQDIAPLLPQAMVEIMVEAQEPLMVTSRLFDRISHEAGTQVFWMPATGAITAEDIAEGQAYPEKTLNIGGATQQASIGKVGLQLAFTEETLRYSRWDIVGMHVRAAGRAFARKREMKGFDHIRYLGQPVFDNKAPQRSILGTTGGRSITGAGNGSIVMDDLFDMYAQILHQGYMPDTLLMHPLTWIMFVKDPTLRMFTLQSGGGTMFASYTGDPRSRFQGPGSPRVLPQGAPVNVGTPLNGSPSEIGQFSQTLNSAPQIPGYFPYPLNIIVTPFARFDPATKLTDIMMFDSKVLGAFIEDEALTTDQWNDPKVDIQRMKFRERYGLMIYEQGLGIATAKNIRVVPNEIYEGPAFKHIDMDGTIGELDRTAPVV